MADFSDPFQRSPLKSKDYDPEPAREDIRALLTVISGVTFFVIMAVYVAAAWLTPKDTWTQVKDAMQAVLPAVTSVLGTVLGFYFGTQKRP
jgi:hypothetical protein